MKKTTIAIILALAAFSFIQAQNADVSYSGKKNDDNPNGIKAGDKNAPSAKVEKDFSRSCIGAENIHWSIVPEGSIAYYTLNEKKGVRVYNKKNAFEYDILSYSEDKLPPNIRDMVKQTYYLDYTITLAQEIHTKGKLIYVVQIQDKKTLKQLRICDDEIEVLKEYRLQASSNQ
jgi:hypothetical protein